MTGQNNKLRIIGGQWRGRKLGFPDEPGLRPTPDRVRETLFNWLQAFIEGSRCLDLCAGSGALGFEALSRHASNVTLVDENRAVISALYNNIELLQTDHAQVIQANVCEFLATKNQASETYTIVFLDPPYHKGLVIPCCEALEQHNFLAPVSYIYIEAEAPVNEALLPDTFSIVRSKKTGNVHYHLIKRVL